MESVVVKTEFSFVNVHRAIVVQVAALAKGSQVAEVVMRPDLVKMGGGQSHMGTGIRVGRWFMAPLRKKGAHQGSCERPAAA